jgi:hypothetical protein
VQEREVAGGQRVRWESGELLLSELGQAGVELE